MEYAADTNEYWFEVREPGTEERAFSESSLKIRTRENRTAGIRYVSKYVGSDQRAENIPHFAQD